MRHYSMSDREGYQRILPKNGRDRRSLFVILGYFLLAIACAMCLLYLKQRHADERERNWTTVTATIEDVRPSASTRANSQGGGAMFYEVEIFVHYSIHGEMHERWVTVPQPPKLLAEAQLQAFRWKGKMCALRWRPSDPNSIYAEVS
jgi:hypothetical protein